MNGVIYARYSSDNQREESIEGQIRECKEFAKRNKIKVVGTYIDRAYSAKTDNRPEFQRMIKESGKGFFDSVIVWKLDRFARNRYDSAHHKATLKKNGVKVISAKETIAEDSTGILLESLLEGYAEFFSVELGEKVVRGMTENALKCKYNGGSVPIGYKLTKDNHFEIDPEQAPLVLDIFTMYSEGDTIKQIADFLNLKGVKNKQGRPMNIDSVTRLLKNRKYIGEYRFRDIVNPNGIPAIVPLDLFDRVQEMREKNKKAPARRKAEDEYLLTTKLYCGKCGAFMVGESGTSKQGKVHRYYKCVTAKTKKACSKKSVRKNYIEQLVIQSVMDRLNSDTVLGTIADGVMALQKEENTLLPSLKKQLKDAQKGINNLVSAIEQGIITPTTKERLNELEEQKSDLEVSIAKEEIRVPIFTKKQIVFWLKKFRGISLNNQKQKQWLIDTFINSIYLYDDKLVVNLNYKDGTKTLSLKELEESDLEALGRPNSLHFLA